MSTFITYLIKDKLVDEKTLLQAIQTAQKQKIALLRFLVEKNLICSDKIMQCLAKRLNLPVFDLTDYSLSLINSFPLSVEQICEYRVLPLAMNHHNLQIGLSDPTDQFTIDAIIFLTGLRLSLSVVDEKKLALLLKKIVHSPNELDLTVLQKLEQKNFKPQMTVKAEEEPLIQFVDQLLQHAVQLSASDIHIEPCATDCRIRYRRDGVLHEMTKIPQACTSQLLARLKVMAKLDITEKRLPQDGHFHAADRDIRINSCPTFFGEKIVLRLLNAKHTTLNLDSLGFNPSQKNLFIKNISNPHGLILVTGPTGCGKTSTLYSALHYLNTPTRNISTVEDPIEIQLSGVNQVNVLPKIGLDFATVLRTLLRQDPDVMMIGEIRDEETANIAIQAAQTGHLVFSTLHTKSAIETIARLMSMNIPTYNLLNAISLIVAQRLVRILCQNCKQVEYIADKMIFKEKGCEKCFYGFQGRTGIYEFLTLDEKIIECLLTTPNMQKIQNDLKKPNNQTLYQSGLEKVYSGITSFSELNRVLLC